MLLTTFLSFYSTEYELKGSIIILLLLLYMIILYKNDPYKLKYIKNIEMLSFICAVNTIILGIILSGSYKFYIISICYILLLGINCLFILFMLYKIFIAGLEKFQK